MADYQKGLRNFFIVAVLGYIAYAILDFFEQYYIGLLLRIIIITFCLIPIAVNLRKMDFERMKFFSNLSLFLLFLLEIETQLQAPDVPFYHSSAWFADIIIMLIHSMYFLGTPLHYSLFWFTLICYYFLRTYLTVSGNMHHAITNAWLYHFATWLFGSVFNTWWFRTRYTNAINQIRYKEEYEKRIFLENELSRARERESIFADIHDNLGGKLLDLSFKLDKIQLDKPISFELKGKLRERIEEVLKGLRNRLLAFEDMEKIETDFTTGIQNFLVRRYSLASRKIQFDVDANMENLVLEKSTCLQILNIFQELVNNDLKYGSGKSIWSFGLADSTLYLQFQSLTDWDMARFSTGNGYKTIQSRVKELNGELIQNIAGNKYLVEFKFPIVSM